MLALTTGVSFFSLCNFVSSKATQPLPRAKPYSADRLSPSTSMGFDAEYALMLNAASAIHVVVRMIFFILFLNCSDLLKSICMRSEEHTSELQSLMRISYAVFCLK